MHDYGLKKYDELAMRTQARYKPFKKVVLTNVRSAQNRITVSRVEKRLKGSLGLPEWERKQAVWLVEAIVDALKKGEKSADITKMFSCEFVTEDDEILPQKDIQKELIYRLFLIVDETEEVLRLKLDWRAIFL